MRRMFCILLLSAATFPLLGCSTESGIKEGVPPDAKASGPPPDVKDMEKNMMNPKAK